MTRGAAGRAGVGSASAGAAAPRPARSPASQRVRVLMTTPGGAVGPVLTDVIGTPALPGLQILPIVTKGGGGGFWPAGTGGGQRKQSIRPLGIGPAKAVRLARTR